MEAGGRSREFHSCPTPGCWLAWVMCVALPGSLKAFAAAGAGGACVPGERSTPGAAGGVNPACCPAGHFVTAVQPGPCWSGRTLQLSVLFSGDLGR